MQDTNSPTKTQAFEEIPGEPPADRAARLRRHKRSVKWSGHGSGRHRKVYRGYGHEKPLIDQNAGRIVSVQLIRKGDTE